MKWAANLQEDTHPKVWFQKSCFTTLLKSHFGMVVLLQICSIYSEHIFIRTLTEGWFCNQETEGTLKSNKNLLLTNMKWCSWVREWSAKLKRISLEKIKTKTFAKHQSGSITDTIVQIYCSRFCDQWYRGNRWE